MRTHAGKAQGLRTPVVSEALKAKRKSQGGETPVARTIASSTPLRAQASNPGKSNQAAADLERVDLSRVGFIDEALNAI